MRAGQPALSRLGCWCRLHWEALMPRNLSQAHGRADAIRVGSWSRLPLDLRAAQAFSGPEVLVQ